MAIHDKMSVLSSLLDVLDGAKDELQEDLLVSLLRWNENIESLLVNPDPAVSSSFLEASVEVTLTRLEECAKSTHNSIISPLLRLQRQEDISVGDEEKRAEQVLRWVKTIVTGKDIDLNVVSAISILFRTTKNLLRSYLQIVLPSRLRSNVNAATAVLEYPTEILRNQTMMELYAVLMEKNSGNDAEHQELARNASLALFYATYSGSSNDTTIQQSQLFLIENIDFPIIVMKVLVQHNTPPLLLSTMRIVHNLMVTLPQATTYFQEVTIELESQPEKAPWTPIGEESANFVTVTAHLLRWLLQATVPPFPGRVEDRLDDLFLEILHTWFAMRAGRSLESPTLDTLMSQLVVETLRLPDSDERCFRCKLAMIGVLTESNQVFGDYLASHDVLPFLLLALEQQVSHVVDESVTGSAAATAAVPIMMVVNKFSIGNPVTKQLVKNFIFPQEAEADFQVKAAEEKKRAAGSSFGAKNMSPLDAPKGTLRWKLFKLMTWTQSNTKRVAGELLWTLCDNDVTQFALRAGLGNALTILAAKGYATLPV